MEVTSKTGAGVYYRKRIRRDLPSVSLNADMIRLLLVIDDRKSLYQISAEAEMDAATFKRTLGSLLEQGLIEPVQHDTPPLDHIFLHAMRLNLSRVIGPMAEILIDDVMAEMGLNPSHISVDQAAEIINRLALEIPDEPGQIRFKKSMIPLLKKVTP
jgi:DNA-binding IclR family transcriptional regulator